MEKTTNKMKTAKQLIKEYLDKGSNMPVDGMVLLTKFECELLMEKYAQEVVKNNFVLADVSGSLPPDVVDLLKRLKTAINQEEFIEEIEQMVGNDR